jgi:iron complex transport system permease protein
VLALFGVSPFATQWLMRLGLTVRAFAGAVGAVLLTLLLAKGVQHTLRLLLAGVIVGVVLGAAKELIMLARPDFLQSMQAFMLGSTGFVGWTACSIMLGAWLVCMAVAWALSPVLDGLALGEATAASLGLPLARLRRAGGRAGAGHRHRGGADRPDRLCRPGRAASGALRGQDQPWPS